MKVAASSPDYFVHAAKLNETPPLTTSEALLASRREIVRPTLPKTAIVDVASQLMPPLTSVRD